MNRIRRRPVELLVVLHVIPLNGPTLEKVESGGSNEPKNHINDVCPPCHVLPIVFEVDAEESAIEEEDTEFDECEGWPGQYHGRPDVLCRVMNITGRNLTKGSYKFVNIP